MLETPKFNVQNKRCYDKILNNKLSDFEVYLYFNNKFKYVVKGILT